MHIASHTVSSIGERCRAELSLQASDTLIGPLELPENKKRVHTVSPSGLKFEVQAQNSGVIHNDADADRIAPPLDVADDSWAMRCKLRCANLRVTKLTTTLAKRLTQLSGIKDKLGRKHFHFAQTPLASLANDLCHHETLCSVFHI